MIRISLSQRRPGFLLLEVLVGITVFGLFASAIGFTLLYGQENTINSGDRIRATFLTGKALEATRAIRDASFSSVTTGTHGVYVNPATDKWTYTGSSVTNSGGFVTRVTITQLASDWVRATGLTTWKRGYNRSGSVLVVSELTDWRSENSIGNWSSITAEGTYTDGGTPQFNNLAVWSGSYVFLTYPSSPGLQVIDIRTLSAPARVNSSFSLGVGAYAVAVRGSVLYVATANSTEDIRAYNIASPTSFGAAELIGSYNVPGSARVRSLLISGDMLYAGTTASATAGEDEFYAFSIASPGGIALRDSVNDDSSTVQMIALSGTSAYLASSMDTSEIRVVNIADEANLSLLGGYNLSDRTVDTQSIAISGTSALVGSLRLSSGQEVVLLDLENGGVPDPPPGPWYHEGSGSVVGLAMDPTRCYGFISALSNKKAFQVFNVRNKSTLAEITTYNSSTGVGRGLLYDFTKDRVYLITDRSLIIFRPGVATGTCP